MENVTQNTEKFSEKDYFEYAWKHFTVIADQRLKTFNFYIIIVAASIAATVAAVEKTKSYGLMLACGLMHPVCALVFFLVDERSRRLVNIPKEKLMQFEDKNGWELFRKDITMQEGCWNKLTSYTAAFRVAFFFQTVFGGWIVIMAVTSMFSDRP
jgi:hypothetical protein